jgi:tetratricopeptide (TPR) repeat protein
LGGLLLCAPVDKAIEEYCKALEIAPDFPQAHNGLGNAYEQKGMYDEAVAHFMAEKFAEATPASPEVLEAARRAYAESGIKGYWRRELSREIEAAKRSYVSPIRFIAIYARLEDNDQVIAWLQKAYEERSAWLVFLAVEPRYDKLRSDLRFTDLLQRIGLAP